MSDISAPLIDLRDVSFTPDSTPVLRDVTLQTNEKRIAIVGRNGSGKTSLARVLTGLTAPTVGRVRIGGVDVFKDRKGALRTIGILFQNPDHQIIFPTVEEEIGFGLTQLGWPSQDRARGVGDILSQFGKEHWAKAAVHHLSQGQRQLVCLMSILAMAPKVIVLDEPFAGLDIPTTLHLARVLDGLEVTLLQITHDPRMVQHYERVIWLDEGRVMQDGPAASVLPVFEARMRLIGGQDDLSDIAS